MSRSQLRLRNLVCICHVTARDQGASSFCAGQITGGKSAVLAEQECMFSKRTETALLYQFPEIIEMLHCPSTSPLCYSTLAELQVSCS